MILVGTKICAWVLLLHRSGRHIPLGISPVLRAACEQNEAREGQVRLLEAAEVARPSALFTGRQ